MPLPDLITLKDPRSISAEAFRTLRTNIQFAGADKPIRVLVVTSPTAEDDRVAENRGNSRSATVANLAVTLAQGGHNTILVDADLHRPRQHTLWGLDNAFGLTSMLMDDSRKEEIPAHAVGVDHLSVLTSGPLPQVPADMLGSQRMETVIAALREKAQFVIFDAPPVLAVSDAPLLATRADGLLLLIRSGSTRRDHAQRAREVLERLHVRIIGAALLNAPHDSGMGNY